MKKMILIMSILTLMGYSASSAERMAVVRNGEIFKVIYSGEDVANVNVTIRDSDGNKVFSEDIISVHGFIRPYNFSQLSKGDYLICVTDKLGRNTEKVCYEER